ncbi:InlB B-repeat-containing protein [Erysipelothrix sp. HDW6C]|uniref:InlB B-repeat-containing protein n=1 Tax=Erysipelothrix sp. HDW6C TaxID=2714930 RepID=UPI00140DE913|nr:InlB B-repeat-containing protein [Erysipelothrix sp. HDW6C]QIK70598.1 InlB B-repeat-containing protein [Erysipelothrix sp. HDW6C]
MYKRIMPLFVALTLIIGIGSLRINADETDAVNVESSANIEDSPMGSTQSIALDANTNLLINHLGEDVTTFTRGRDLYELDSVTITRHRPKVNIEYYYGDYNTYDLVATESGYVDYDEYFSDYYKSVAQLNTEHGLALPTSNIVMVRIDGLKSLVPAYDGVNNEYTVKLLIGEKITRSITISTYMNRQDRENPSPVGKTETEIKSKEDFFAYNNLSTGISAMKNTPILIQSRHNVGNTRTERGRTGELSHLGIFGADSVFYETDSYVVTQDLPARTYIGAFYHVDDFGSPVQDVNPSSSVTSGASVGFVSGNNNPEWKNPTVSETLYLNDEASHDKLGAYPFEMDGDPFDNPEFVPYWPPANWMTGHKLDIHYEYGVSQLPVPTYTVTFDSNGGSEVFPLTDVAEGSSIQPPMPTKDGYTLTGWTHNGVAWNFMSDQVMGDMTLVAVWEENPVVVLSYTVSFDSDGGSAVAPLKNIVAGSTISAPTVPTKAGYTFSGWMYNGVAWNFATDAVNGNMLLKATWTPNGVNPTPEVKPEVTPEVKPTPGPTLPATGVASHSGGILLVGLGLAVVAIQKKRK